jgi:hypothetical protein
MREMKPETAKKLEAILDVRQKEKQAATTQPTERQNAEAKNLADFLAKQGEVIKPAFQEIVDLYKARGIAIHIVEEDERTNTRGGTDSPTIALDMSGEYDSSFRRTSMKPEFKLRFEKHKRSLSLHTSTGSQSGPAGDVLLDAITADWIQDAFVKYQSSSFR